MKFRGLFGVATLMVLAVGCAEEAPPTTTEGNQALGIASFTTNESPTTTTVVGLDAAGHEVGRVELTHGVFTLSPMSREDYDTDQVDGRKLEATLGEHKYLFEREGYESLMHMPGFPASEAELATLLADPHVKPILDGWQLGFDTVSTSNVDEQAYTSYSKAGTLVQSCNGASNCGNVIRTGTNAGTYLAGTCGGTATAIQANRIAITSTTVDEIAQCCPAGSGGLSYAWWARKQCPKNGLTTQNCGDVTAGKACVGCGSFLAGYSCSVTYSGGSSVSNYQAICRASCTYQSQCGQPDGCGGTCETFTYPMAGICTQ